MERVKKILERLEAHHGRLHNFFLQPHLDGPVDTLTIIPKNALIDLKILIDELGTVIEARNVVTNNELGVIRQRLHEIDEDSEALLTNLQALQRERQTRVIDEQHLNEEIKQRDQEFEMRATALRNQVEQVLQHNFDLRMR